MPISTKSLQNNSRGRSSRPSVSSFICSSTKNIWTMTQIENIENIEKFLRTAFFIEHLWWLLLKRGHWTPPQRFCILMNIYECLNVCTLGSISQYGNVSWAKHLPCIYDSAGRERNNFQQLNKNNWTKIHFCNITSIAYSYK